tara:strand:+ start:6182 stop:6424 length:243 start_codon:yes stop_codon:yes gene_type:complete
MSKFKQLTLMSILSIFGSITIANTNIDNPVINKNDNQIEESEIYDCSLECHRKCEAKEKVPISCVNNSCTCGAESESESE